MIREREVSAAEVMEAHLTRIEQVNPSLNAIVTLVADEARHAAGQADTLLSSGGQPGPLHGLPVAHKDLVPTKGIRTTFGSPIFADFVPDEDALLVERLRAAGAITVGKTNTPEFGLCCELCAKPLEQDERSWQKVDCRDRPHSQGAEP